MNDQTAQMGFQMGQQAMARVGEGMEQSVCLSYILFSNIDISLFLPFPFPLFPFLISTPPLNMQFIKPSVGYP